MTKKNETEKQARDALRYADAARKLCADVEHNDALDVVEIVADALRAELEVYIADDRVEGGVPMVAREIGALALARVTAGHGRRSCFGETYSRTERARIASAWESMSARAPLARAWKAWRDSRTPETQKRRMMELLHVLDRTLGWRAPHDLCNEVRIAARKLRERDPSPKHLAAVPAAA